MDDAVADGLTDAAAVGQVIILPSSFTGSPRALNQLYQDAMGIVRRFGKPDYFITMTTNPNWPEIIGNLQEGQMANDRPDLMARAFRLRLVSSLRTTTMMTNSNCESSVLRLCISWMFLPFFRPDYAG